MTFVDLAVGICYISAFGIRHLCSMLPVSVYLRFCAFVCLCICAFGTWHVWICAFVCILCIWHWNLALTWTNWDLHFAFWTRRVDREAAARVLQDDWQREANIRDPARVSGTLRYILIPETSRMHLHRVVCLVGHFTLTFPLPQCF